MIGRRPISFTQTGADVQCSSPIIGQAYTKGGTPTYTTGKFGQAMQGSGNGNYWYQTDVTIVIPDTTAFCVEYWIKFEGNDLSNTGGQKYFFSITSTPNTFRIYNGGSGNIIHDCRIGATTALNQNIPFASYNLSQWYHEAFTFDVNGLDGGATTAALYIDGVSTLTDTASWTPTNFSSGQDMAVTQAYSAAAPMAGVIDNIKIYNYGKTNFRDRHFNTSQTLG